MWERLLARKDWFSGNTFGSNVRPLTAASATLPGMRVHFSTSRTHMDVIVYLNEKVNRIGGIGTVCLSTAITSVASLLCQENGRVRRVSVAGSVCPERFS